MSPMFVYPTNQKFEFSLIVAHEINYITLSLSVIFTSEVFYNRLKYFV